MAADQSTRLRAWLRRTGLSQEALGQRLDPPVDRTTVNGYVSGRRGVPPGFWQALEQLEQEAEAAA